MNVLIGCECSSAIRDAFNARGHNAWSCDLKPSEGRQANHLQGDVRHAIAGNLHKFDAVDMRTGRQPIFIKWDLFIVHPVCQYLCNSGVRWLYKDGKEENGLDEQRWRNLEAAANFFTDMLAAPIEKICVENPVMHKYAQELIDFPPTQTIQPWMFGHLEVKATALWLKQLPKLVPTKNVKAETMALPYAERAKVHYASPGKNRSTVRARTYAGVAEAMAEQWGKLWPL